MYRIYLALPSYNCILLEKDYVNPLKALDLGGKAGKVTCGSSKDNLIKCSCSCRLESKDKYQGSTDALASRPFLYTRQYLTKSCTSTEADRGVPYALCLGLLLTQGITSYCIVACLYVPRSC